MGEKFLDHLYDTDAPVRSNALYDAWAETYEAELIGNGYATPARIAAALAQHVSDPGALLLDYGCGTGLSGLALRAAGFDQLHGMDPSEKMLQIARQKDIYKALHQMEIDDPAPIPPGQYPVIAAIGVIGPGAAPASTLDILIRALPKAGILAVSLNDHAVAAKIYEGAMCNWLDPGAARLLEKQHGPHLPGKNIKANIYIIEKT